MSSLGRLTTALADALCGGSSRKLIAGWWYAILFLCFVLFLLSFWTVSTRDGAESFCSFWSASLILLLCVGGTMVMRKFHNRTATGFFLGALVGAAQFFFLLFLIYGGYAMDRMALGVSPDQDWFQAVICLFQSLLLASFALILGVHRSAIMDKHSTLHNNKIDGPSESEDSYRPPTTTMGGLA